MKGRISLEFVGCDESFGVMSRVVLFDINLGSTTGIFEPGEVISGSVCVETTENLPVHGNNSNTMFY